jgi:hypothetical protein
MILFSVGFFATKILPYSPSFPYYDSLLPSYHLPQWFYSWANFDGVHYLTIAEKGYFGTGLVQAFFPLFPLVLLHSLKGIFGEQFNALLVGVVLSNIFFLALMFVWFSFVKEIYNEAVAWISLTLFVTFPTAFFFGALYTESLFLLLVLAAFWAAERKNWMLTGIFSALASATRVVGIFLLPAFFVGLIQEFGVQKWMHKKFLPTTKKFLQQNWRACCWIAFGSIGLLSYMFFLTVTEFHDPLYFAHVQSQFNSGRQDSLVLYPQVVWRAAKILLTSRPFDWHYLAYVQEFMVGVGGFFAILASWKYVRSSFIVFALGSFLLPTLTGTFSSLPRYFLACFCVYIAAAQVLQKRSRIMVFCVLVSVVFLIINTLLFVQGFWVA